MPDLSPEAKDRARRTVDVATVFGDHADEIAEAVAALPEGTVLVAVVDGAHRFTGTHHVSTEDLVERVSELEGPGGWAMVFSPGADPAHVRRRSGEMASIASKRVDAIDRITAKQQNG